jgi:PAS domain S-box-containing protein
VLRHVRSRSALAELPVVVLTSLDSDEEIRRVFSGGADDYVRKPFRPAELVARLRVQIRMRDYLERLSRRERDQQTVLELTQALASSLDIRDILTTVVKRIAEVARVDRCSIVVFADSGRVGRVLASSDDEKIRDLPIDLEHYPEIREVVATGRALVIHNAEESKLLEVVRQRGTARGVASLALIPILHDSSPFGVLFLRSKSRVSFSDAELSLVSTIANATAIALRNARILKSLRDETEQSAFARVEAEQRVELFRRYAGFFESAADGMVVIDRAGRVLFSNPSAREITGSSEAELAQSTFEDILSSKEKERAGRLLRGFGAGVYPRGVDLWLRERAGRSAVVNVSFSSVLHDDDAVVFTFRDVTQERQLAIELKQTKEFLECVIDSSVDAIVSANLEGTVLLFNRASARIFGYNPADVVGKMSVEKLYPPGVAREVMRKIRDPDVSGYGRVEDFRVEMLGADGRSIPVQISASLVVESGRPIGSVGIFTDLREKMRVQAELEHAQDELRNREKQALIAELAGAAAHELNQPLMIVGAYAQLLARQVEADAEARKTAEVITAEAQRMADIVRKVGSITKYETKSYVGEAKILDLELASEPKSSRERLPRRRSIPTRPHRCPPSPRTPARSAPDPCGAAPSSRAPIRGATSCSLCRSSSPSRRIPASSPIAFSMGSSCSCRTWRSARASSPSRANRRRFACACRPVLPTPWSATRPDCFRCCAKSASCRSTTRRPSTSRRTDRSRHSTCKLRSAPRRCSARRSAERALSVRASARRAASSGCRPA